VPGTFDFIVAHGIFSWVPEETRDALFALCADRLSPGGLLYLNYNARPGWNVRGMVRDLLLANTAGVIGLERRVARAKDVAAKLAASLEASAEHPYTRLLEGEFRFVRDSDSSYVAHEFLAPDNHPYWRREFFALARRYGLEHVADADFNYSSGRVPAGLPQQIAEAGLLGQPADDTIDLLSYRQLHSPILTRGPWAPRAPTDPELAGLVVASCLAPDPNSSDGRMFRHPNGFEVEAKQESMRSAFERLRPLWPRGIAAGALFAPPDLPDLMDDLRLLHTHGLIDLRLVDPGDGAPPAAPLNQRERRWGGDCTTPYHTREPA
jgi:hypothetical protein